MATIRTHVDWGQVRTKLIRTRADWSQVRTKRICRAAASIAGRLAARYPADDFKDIAARAVQVATEVVDLVHGGRFEARR